MELRLERDDDREAVGDVQRRAFGDHGTMVAALVDDLRGLPAPGWGLSMVAEEDGRVVGHVMFTPALLDAPRRLVRVQVLSPLAVLPERSGRGVGSALVRAGFGSRTSRGHRWCFWRVRRTTTAASVSPLARRRAFDVHHYAFPMGRSRAQRLTAYEPWMTGTLVYAQAFWEHDAVGLRDPDAADHGGVSG